MAITIYIGCIILGYLLGSIPNGYLIGKLIYHKDVRKEGSGNIGSTNVGRVCGKKAGFLCLILDACKVALPFWLMVLLLHLTDLKTYDPNLIAPYFVMLAACIGHCFPVFLHFKGGKAVATFFGCLLCTNWILSLLFIFIFLLIAFIKHYVSLASIIGALSIAVLSWLLLIPGWGHLGMYPPLTAHFCYPLIFLVNSLLLLFRHRGNIARLKNGTENTTSR